MECVELNWLCKHIKKVKSIQASISINSCTEMSRKQSVPVSIFKKSKNYFSHETFVEETIQFNISLTLRQIPLMYCYSQVDLQKKHQSSKLIYTKFDGKLKKSLIFKVSQKVPKTIFFSWSERIKVFVVKFCNL